MARQTWLERQRVSIEQRYDSRYSRTFDTDAGPITRTHRRFVERVVASCPPGGSVLDAACGTGRYFEIAAATGRTIVGTDQSAGMLARARQRNRDVELMKVALQELAFERAFDAAMCIDAMEYVPPEDWPLVLANLRRAVRIGGLIYLTVEQIDSAEVANAFNEATAGGIPVVYGENLRRGGGYHHYPTLDRVSDWLVAEGLETVDSGVSRARTYGYLHLLLREGVPSSDESRPE